MARLKNQKPTEVSQSEVVQSKRLYQDTHVHITRQTKNNFNIIHQTKNNIK